MQAEIFWPVIVLVGLTALIGILLYVRRISEIRRARIDPQALATRDKASAILKNVSAADNFRNLFEVPVLFYAVCIALAITGEVTPLQLTLAWAYVVLRALHSLIHVTYNRVVHRFAVYTLSTICLFVMWGVFAVSLFTRGAA